MSEKEEFFKFLEVADKICKEKGKIYKFNCPICNNEAQAIKNDYNGHLFAKCEKCDLIIME